MTPKPEAQQKLITWLEKEIKSAEATVADFQAALSNPTAQGHLYAFRNRGGPAVIAAARLDVYRQVHDSLTSEESKATLQTILKYAENEVVNKGVYVGSSTAMLSEHCDRALLAAWTEVYKVMAQIREHGEPLFM
jgi:hypothetical protein